MKALLNSSLFDMLLGLLALAAIATGWWKLEQANSGIIRESVMIGDIPSTVYSSAGENPAPAVVIAHGFAGSQQLMQSFALNIARNGYIAVTFDFSGHGRNPKPLTGSITEAEGATRNLMNETVAVANFALKRGDGRLAVLGHSMASDIVVRIAQSSPDVMATIAVSMFSPVVTLTSPRNLLVIVGDWEGMLKAEALRAVGLAIAPAVAQPGLTYGDLALGTGRRAVFSPHVEHLSVLYSTTSMTESLSWLDQTFGIVRQSSPEIASRGPWILLLLGGSVLLARPLSSLLPRIATPPLGASLGWKKLLLPLLVPMVLTPLLLRIVPTRFLPILVGDYLNVHFAVYGIFTALLLWWTARAPLRFSNSLPLIAAAIIVTAYVFLAMFWPIDTYFTSFVPSPQRAALILVMLLGTLCYFLADEWMTRGESGARGAYAALKLAFMISLAIAVMLDFERLFFLIINVPVVVLFFIVHGLFSAWVYRATGHPLAAGIANALAFAWAIGVTFPMLAGN